MLGAIFEDKYRVERPLTPSPEADRFLGEHIATTRAVEIHVLRDPSNEAAQRKLQGLSQTLGAVSHAAVQRVVDSGFDKDGRLFVVLEAIKGEHIGLFTERNGNAVPPAIAASIVIELAEGVRALHKAGFVLRLIEPRDVIVVKRADDYGAKIIGLRFAMHQTEQRSAVSLLPKSPFLAPELRRGDDILSPSSDIYSLGRLLQHLLTGGTLKQHPSDTATRAILRATAEEPEDRCPDVEVFLQAVGLLAPFQGSLARDDQPIPPDPLDADLHYLALRRANRYGTRHTRVGNGALPLRAMLLVIESLYKKIGQAGWARLVQATPNVEKLLPGSKEQELFATQGVPTELMEEVLQSANVLDGGLFSIVRTIGEMLAQRGLNRVFVDLPATISADGLVEGFPHLWISFFRQGSPAKLDRDGDRARFAVRAQVQPSLELTGLFAGLLRGALRLHGAPRAEVRVSACQALGDQTDLVHIDLQRM